MGSMGASASVLATFTIPVFDDGQSDPAQRPYLSAPKPTSTVKRTYPVVDFRSAVLSNDSNNYDPSSQSASFLSKNGFTAIKHRSALLDPPYARADFESVDLMDKIYYPEIESIIKTLTGCTRVFITNSALRGPKPLARLESKPNEASREFKPSNMSSEHLDLEKPMHMAEPAPPTRIPHMDYTALGARRAVRLWRNDISEAASQAGVIAAEDDICEQDGVQATDKASDEVVNAKYNADGRLGPRYAAYSVWRPLRKVTRDPLAMIPWRDVGKGDRNVEMWQYDIRVPGRDGDWCRELEMLRAGGEVPAKEDAVVDADPVAKWYYVPEQKPDEVLVIKLFDSAALGDGAEGAAGAPHASPDLGEGGYGEARESVEVRLLAFW